jgi:peptidoglycan/LPS O-acetylase OafA/YrhL
MIEKTSLRETEREALDELQTVIAPQARATAGTTSRYYRPELDVLRCLAFFMVFSSHVLPFPHADTGFNWLFAIQEGVSGGVPLFFILTSFLITELLLREQETTGTVHVGAFYMRRILRIWPLYFLALLLAILLPHVIHNFDYVGKYIAPFLLLTGNWVIIVHGWFHNPMLTPLWSTPVQEQFYLLWPLLVVRWGKRGILWSLAIVLPLAWAMDFLLPAFVHGARSPDIWCNSISQFQFFALGSGLALLMHRKPLKLSPWLRAMMFVAAGGAFFFSGTPCHFINDFIPSTPALTLAGYLAIDAGCVLICLAFLGASMPKWTQPLVYLGKISFGLYIFHYTILAIVAAAVKHKLHLSGIPEIAVTYLVTWVIAVGVATLSYRYYEMPFLKLKSRFTFIRSRPA